MIRRKLEEEDILELDQYCHRAWQIKGLLARGKRVRREAFPQEDLGIWPAVIS